MDVNSCKMTEVHRGKSKEETKEEHLFKSSNRTDLPSHKDWGGRSKKPSN